MNNRIGDLCFFLACLLIAAAFLLAMLADVQHARAEMYCKVHGFNTVERVGIRQFRCVTRVRA